MYTWAINPQKLQRAINMAQGQSEDVVKENYIKLGGKLGAEEPTIETLIVEEEPVIEQPIEPTIETLIVAPKTKKTKSGK